MTIDLTPEEAQYLSVLAAADLRADREAGHDRSAELHQGAWEKLQPACQWETP